MSEVTSKQAKYLSYIHAYIEGFGQAPSMNEIAKALKVSSLSVNGMLKSLEKKGLIERKPGVARAIEVLVDPAQIPPWKKKISGSFCFWAPADASQEYLDQVSQQIIENRKAMRRKDK